jgi:hypothetical protein
LNVEDAGPGTDAARRTTAGRARGVAVRGRATRRDRRDACNAVQRSR